MSKQTSSVPSFEHSGLVRHSCFVIFGGRPSLKFGVDFVHAFCDEGFRLLGLNENLNRKKL